MWDGPQCRRARIAARSLHCERKRAARTGGYDDGCVVAMRGNHHPRFMWGFASLALQLLSATEGRAAFERIPAGPEAAAIADIRSVGGDLVFANPASLSSGRGIHGSVWMGHPFGIADVQESQAAFWLQAARAGVGAGFRSFGAPAYFEREVRLTACAAPLRAASDPVLIAGACARLLLVGGDAFAMQTGYGVDLGLRVSLDSETSLGVHLESLAGTFPGGKGRLLNRSSLGISRALPGRLAVLLEMSRRADREPSVAAGFHWTPHKMLILRAGFRDDPPQLSWGGSVHLSSFVVSFSTTETDPLGRTIRIGLLCARFSQADPKEADS